MKISWIRSFSCIVASLSLGAAEELVDPFAGPDQKAPSESEARIVTELGKKTLGILRSEKIDSVRIGSGEFEKGYVIVRDRLAKHGIEVRMKSRAPRKSDIDDAQHPDAALLSKPSGLKITSDEERFFKLENVTIERFMNVLDQWALSGWILYPDGSITYFEMQCACSWPKNGVYCHDSQYDAGKPEAMKAAALKCKKTDIGQSTTQPQLRTEGGAKPHLPANRQK